jgi:hypothetical protein
MATTVFERLDPYVGEDLDSEMLVRELLSNDLPNSEYPTVALRSEIGVDVNSLAEGLLVVYEVAPATPLGHGLFRFPVSLHVFSSDPDMGSRFESYLYSLVSRWPYQEPQPDTAGVSRVQLTGFRRQGPNEWNLARDVHIWSLEDVLVTARLH